MRHLLSIALPVWQHRKTMPSAPNTGDNLFPKTRWTLVRELCAGGAPAERALAELCGIYWYPVYAYLRGVGANPADAEDLTQGFFALLVKREMLTRVDAAKGRLRCFILHALKQFKIDEHRKRVAAKRGGGVCNLSIDVELAEDRYRLELADGSNPEQVFERRWALDLLSQAFGRLETEYAKSGKADTYRALQPFIAGDQSPGETHAGVGEELGMSAGAVQVAIHRMKKRYRFALEACISETVETKEEVTAELNHILKVLASPR